MDSRPAKEKQQRRRRTNFSDQKLARLEETFLKDKYPGIQLREELARELGIREDRIQIWFQNRRSRWRKNAPTPTSDTPMQPFMQLPIQPVMQQPMQLIMHQPPMQQLTEQPMQPQSMQPTVHPFMQLLMQPPMQPHTHLTPFIPPARRPSSRSYSADELAVAEILANGFLT